MLRRAASTDADEASPLQRARRQRADMAELAGELLRVLDHEAHARSSTPVSPTWPPDSAVERRRVEDDDRSSPASIARPVCRPSAATTTSARLRPACRSRGTSSAPVARRVPGNTVPPPNLPARARLLRASPSPRRSRRHRPTSRASRGCRGQVEREAVGVVQAEGVGAGIVPFDFAATSSKMRMPESSVSAKRSPRP